MRILFSKAGPAHLWIRSRKPDSFAGKRHGGSPRRRSGLYGIYVSYYSKVSPGSQVIFAQIFNFPHRNNTRERESRQNPYDYGCNFKSRRGLYNLCVKYSHLWKEAQRFRTVDEGKHTFTVIDSDPYADRQNRAVENLSGRSMKNGPVKDISGKQGRFLKLLKTVPFRNRISPPPL